MARGDAMNESVKAQTIELIDLEGLNLPKGHIEILLENPRLMSSLA
jgi:hypothetical protein